MSDDSEERSRTIFCGNLHDDVLEEHLYELFLQAGPIDRVNIPKNNGKSRNFGFVVYNHVISVPYAVNIFRDTVLFKKKLNIRASSHGNSNRQNQQQQNNDNGNRHSLDNNAESLRQGFNNMASTMQNGSGSITNPLANIMQNSIGGMMNPNMLFNMGSNFLFSPEQQNYLAATAMQLSQQHMMPMNVPYPSQSGDNRGDKFKMTNRDTYRQHDSNNAWTKNNRGYDNDRGNHRNNRDHDRNRHRNRDRDRDRRN